MSTSHRSNGGCPSMIQSASTLPAPPADWMPIELKPAATYRPRISGVSPKRYRSSRVQRHADIRPTAHFARPHAGAVHDGLRADLPVLGRDTGDRPARGADRGDLEVLDDANAGLARAPGERAGRVDRVGLSVLRQKH